MYDLIILGGGPAGQAAAVYALAKKINFLMIYKELGGRVGEKIMVRSEEDIPVGHILVHFESVEPVEKEDHLVGSDAVHLFESQIMGESGHILRDMVQRISYNDSVFHVETEQNGLQQGRTIILATGGRQIPLNIPGENLLVRGLGYTSAAHAEMFTGKSVAVVGVTERALHGAAELAQTAEKVYLISPETVQPTVPVVATLRKHPRVEILENYQVKEVIGTTTVEQLVVEGEGKTRRLNVDTAFSAMALIPNSDIVKDLVDTDEAGFIKINERNATSMPGIYAAGEVSTSFGREVLIAIGEGARAALSAHDYVLTYSLDW